MRCLQRYNKIRMLKINNMKKIATKKTVRKAKQPTIIVNLIGDKDISEVLRAFAVAKVRAGVPITMDELANVCIDSIYAYEADLFSWNNAVIKINGNEYLKLDMHVYEMEENAVCECEPKKPNIFKRVWNWLTKPFKKG